jgi:hypothetical protein
LQRDCRCIRCCSWARTRMSALEMRLKLPLGRGWWISCEGFEKWCRS